MPGAVVKLFVILVLAASVEGKSVVSEILLMWWQLQYNYNNIGGGQINYYM